MTTGFYLMHRGWMDNPALSSGREPFCRRAAWAWLIEAAAWRETRIGLGGKTVILKRGQLSHSTRYMARAWGWSEAGVRRFLDRLKTDAMIDASTDAGQTVVTICNYSTYQADPEARDAPSDAPSDAAATQQRRSSDAKKKEGKEGKKESSEANASSDPLPPSEDDPEKIFEAWWQAYPRYRRGPKGPARKKWLGIVKRRKATPDQLQQGLDRYNAAGYADSEYAAGAERWLNAEYWTVEHFPPPGDGAGRAPPVVPSQKQEGAAQAEELRRRLGSFGNGHDGQPELGRAFVDGAQPRHEAPARLPGPAGGASGHGEEGDAGVSGPGRTPDGFLERAWSGGRP